MFISGFTRKKREKCGISVQVLMDTLQIDGNVRAAYAHLIPVIDLKTDEDANDDDQHLQDDRAPIAIFQARDQSAKNHVLLPKSRAAYPSTRRSQIA